MVILIQKEPRHDICKKRLIKYEIIFLFSGENCHIFYKILEKMDQILMSGLKKEFENCSV